MPMDITLHHIGLVLAAMVQVRVQRVSHLTLVGRNRDGIRC